MNKMNPEVKKKWVAALRSGEYKQTTGALYKDGGFCCLGVLRDIAPPELRKTKASPGEAGTLSKAVCKWAGLPKSNPEIAQFTRATTANDSLNWDFNRIADAIENNL